MPHGRRHRTAKRIQVAAVNLAIKKGLNNITTEEISSASGISPRTFFNYYPYKEAALYGLPIGYPQTAIDMFIQGRNSLLQDLKTLVTSHLANYKDERDLIKNVIALSADEPKLQALLNDQTLLRRDELTEILTRRLSDIHSSIPYILSSAVIAAIHSAVLKWISGEDANLLETAEEYLALIIPAADLLR